MLQKRVYLASGSRANQQSIVAAENRNVISFVLQVTIGFRNHAVVLGSDDSDFDIGRFGQVTDKTGGMIGDLPERFAERQEGPEKPRHGRALIGGPQHHDAV